MDKGIKYNRLEPINYRDGWNGYVCKTCRALFIERINPDKPYGASMEIYTKALDHSCSDETLSRGLRNGS